MFVCVADVVVSLKWTATGGKEVRYRHRPRKMGTRQANIHLEPRSTESCSTAVITVTDKVGLTFMTCGGGRRQGGRDNMPTGSQRKLCAMAVMEMCFKRTEEGGLSSRMCNKVIRPHSESPAPAA